ncbi:MAG: chromosome segregation protein SMC [Spirochaetaceae bacterium]|nr:MAG: chromosome segregation protein SMC [Spirochaetaceae bacterium]
MFLKSIELFGFKSFADRTKIEIRDGISAIVGPNGCGKSNVLDSIKWVLGEQSTKNLRANKMEDIIFNGTEQRKALNVAEVTLMLANENNLFPVEFPEIAVKRRIYRSGENEYFINNNPAKLKEVRELFFDTGIGKSAYSIMEQGKIDQILSNKPEERRYIFEEAAGITGYKVKNLEAERKLEKTEENIRQIEGIMGEVKRSYDTLKAQAEKTVRYRELQDKVFHNELDLQLLKLRNFIADQQKREEELSGSTSSRDVIRHDIDDINGLLEKNIDLVNGMESNLIEIQKKLYGIDIEKNNKNEQIKILEERTAELERKIQYDESRKNGIREKIDRLEAEKSERHVSMQSLVKEMEGIDGNIASFEHNIQLAQQRITVNDKDQANIGAQNQELENALEDAREELRAITDDIVTELDQRLKDTGYSASQRRSLEQKLEEVFSAIKIQLDGKKSILSDAKRLGELAPPAVDALVDAFAHLAERINEAVRLFDNYKKSSPQFLDEFLSPEGIITKKRVIDDKISETLKKVAENRKRIGTLKKENDELIGRIDEYRNTLSELRVNKATLETKKSVMEEDFGRLGRDIAEQAKLEAENLAEIDQTRAVMREISKSISDLEQMRKKAEQEEKDLKSKIGELEKDIGNKNQLLLSKEKLLKEKMGSLEKVQAKVEKIQMLLAEINAEIRNTNENFKEKYSRELADYRGRMYEIKKSVQEIKESGADLRERIAKLGQINLMAPEEFEEIRERFEFLNTQLADLKKAREDLMQITAKIREESTRRFEEAYNAIRKHFNNTFRRLFGGGRAELKLSEPDKIMESGIEILAQPPGKKLEYIALLSGGERSLIAIALLFAVYMVKPSPFCVLDEIDAALDDRNIGQFVTMLDEFADKSQFLVITHNKKTVTSASSLLGITMEESGVSKLVSMKLKNREQETGNDK